MADTDRPPVVDLTQYITRLEKLRKRLGDIRADLGATARALADAAKEFEKVCPHEKIVECEDGKLPFCIQCASDHPAKHPARMCELCGAYEDRCPVDVDGYKVLTSATVRLVPFAEFMTIHNTHVLWRT